MAPRFATQALIQLPLAQVSGVAVAVGMGVDVGRGVELGRGVGVSPMSRRVAVAQARDVLASMAKRRRGARRLRGRIYILQGEGPLGDHGPETYFIKIFPACLCDQAFRFLKGNVIMLF